MKNFILIIALFILNISICGQFAFAGEKKTNLKKDAVSQKHSKQKQYLRDSEVLFRIYPNPSSNGLFNIDFVRDLNIKEISVYNILGGKEFGFVPETRKNEPIRIDLSTFPRGIYLLKIESGEGDFFKKIMK